jgi:hypothetical protein
MPKGRRSSRVRIPPGSHRGGRPITQAFNPIDFVARHGVVLASAKGTVPNVAEAVAGEPVRGSWWAHKKGSEIFRALSALGDSPDVLCFRLVAGKITFVHRRLWPALVRMAEELGRERLTAIEQRHTETGAHRNILTPFPLWVPPEVKDAALRLPESEARAQIGAWVQAEKTRNTPRRKPRGD